MRQQFVHEWFSQTAEKLGSAIAIVYGSRRVTYGELEERTNRLANFLSAAGARRGARVAIFVEDTVDVITSIIATLKIGGVFIPLDPATPAARLLAMISDVSPEWFIVESGLAGILAAGVPAAPTPARVICLDSDPPPLGHDNLIAVSGSIADADSRRPTVVSEPDDMCYVYFTSGSTGVPKGIAGRLKAIDHFIRWEINTFNIGEGTRVSHLTTPTFDASLRDIFTPLCAGGTVCAPPSRDVVLDAQRLVRWLDGQKIQLLHTVPSLFRSIVQQELNPGQFSTLRHILLAGEPLPPADVKKWMDVFGDRAQIVNLYGPSETTMTKFFHVVQPGDLDRRSIPIGKPMEGARALIMDDNGKACPAGVVGEIYIRTPYRALGYFNQVELTNQAFIRNPFNPAPGDLIYKTGDIGRVLEDGNFEILGRKDRQVKIRGLRIELAEIEDLLRRHPVVRDVVVIDRTDSQGQSYLCAYLATGEAIDASALREHLSPHLPEYMLPSAFVVLESLPRTTTGKIDIKALPSVDRAGLATRGIYIGPRTPVEEVLANLWADVLKVERVSVTESFFELGGHSLIATQVISRVRDTFHWELPLRTLFERPTVAAFAEAVEANLRGAGRPSAPAMTAVKHRENPPLSFSQRRLWFLAQLEHNSPAYNIPVAIRVKGALRIDALENAFNEIIRRHEALRASFTQIDGEPVQRIHGPMRLAVPIVDLTGWPAASREARAAELAAEEAQTPFSLEQAPLLRVRLLTLGEDEFLLLFTMHHIISDGWSMGVLVEEFATFYEQFVNGDFSPRPELEIQYADFAEWQRKWLQGEALEELLDYWRNQLEGAADTQLPTDHQRPSQQTFRGANVSFVTPKAIGEKLAELSKRRQATLFMTLLSAFKALLRRYTGQDDISVGAPIANRNRTEIEKMIGCFVNTLALRTDLSGDLYFPELLTRVRDVALGAYAHQDLPFEKLIETLHANRDTRRSPLFQVIFELQNATRRGPLPSGLKFNVEEVNRGTAKFDLELLMEESEDGLLGVFTYNTDLFERETILRLADHFQNILASIAADPQQRLSKLSSLPETQRREMLVARNDSAFDFGPAKTFIPLFEAQVERTPEAIAIRCREDKLSYNELNRRANRLARALVEAGIGSETVVALLAERGLNFLTAMLAIFKAGAAYLPLNPAYPPARNAELIEQSNCALVLIEDTLAGALIGQPQPGMLMSIQEAKNPDRQDGNLPESGWANSLAYVIYTSGSTGKPKGSMLEQAGMINHLQNKLKELAISGSDVIVQNASQSFDISVWQFLTPLLAGATVLVIPDEEIGDPARLLDRMESGAASILEVVPSLLRALIETVELAEAGAWKLGSMRMLISNGEALSAQLCRQWLGLFPNIPMFNAYGPTECSDDVTHHYIESLPFDDGMGSMPLGKPLANLQVYVLDKDLEPAPVGVPGEVYIGGVGVGRGYLGQPGLTAERFIPDPFSDQPDARLYKTGDLARYLSDGSLRFISRIGHQVKVRGYRIELGEIDAVLSKHPAVKEAVVLVEDGPDEDKRLTAYVVLNQPEAVATADLRKWLKDRLPGFMAPGLIVQIAAMPLTANGKLDRKALAAYPRELAVETSSLSPRDTLELELAQIFSEVLGVGAVGVKDSFFDLGGHSLLAVRLVARIQQSMGRSLPLAALLGSPTVEEIAAILRQEASSKPESVLAPIQPNGSKQPFYCVHPTGGNVLCYFQLAQRLGPDQPFYGLQAQGLNAGEILADVGEMAAAYVEAIRAHQPEGPYLLGGWSFGAFVAFEMACRLKQQGEDVALLALLDIPAPTPRHDAQEPDDLEALMSLADAIGNFADRRLDISADELRRLDSDQQLLYVMEQARKAEVLPLGLDVAHARRYLQVAKSNELAEQRYIADLYDGQVTLFRASESVAAFPGPMDWGWGELSTEEVAVHQLPGDHHSIMRAPHVQVLADRLKACLEQAQSAERWDIYNPHMFDQTKPYGEPWQAT